MKITPLVAQLRARCPIFETRVAGALEFTAMRESALLPAISAFVIPTGDNAGENQTQNTTRQDVTEEFDVCVLVKTGDPRGQSSADLLHVVRAQLWLALVGWKPGGGYGPIAYRDSELVQLNRELICYYFGFSSVFAMTGRDDDKNAETWQQWYLDGLPLLKRIHVDFDVIDPIADPNLRRPGPDGRIEFSIEEDFGHDRNDEGQTR